MKWSKHFSHCKFSGIFPDSQGQLLPQVSCRIWPKFKRIQAFTVALVTGKNDEDPFKNEGTRVVITLNIDFLRRSRAAYSTVGDGIRPQLCPLIGCTRNLHLRRFNKDAAAR